MFLSVLVLFQSNHITTMLNLDKIPANQIPSFIDKLCDVVVNKKRKLEDFELLLTCVQNMPRESTPFKDKIVQHLHIHGIENPCVDLNTVSTCFAQASLLHAKTPNKTEGPLGAWKAALSSELQNFDYHINATCNLVGIKTNEVLASTKEASDSSNVGDFKAVIDKNLLEVNLSAHNICALLSLETDFDLPIPIDVLTRLALKALALRWVDFKNSINGTMKIYVYSLSPYFVDIGLMMIDTLIKILGPNLVPYTQPVNQGLLNLLEWSRVSDLANHNERFYISVRTQVFRLIKKMLDTFSLNINLGQNALKTLLDLELLNNIQQLLSNANNSKETEQLFIAATRCLDSLILVYANYIDDKLKYKLKCSIVESCLAIYRNFETASLKPNIRFRSQMLNLLLTISNQPYATTTTEVVYNLLELVERLEIDTEMKSQARKILMVGLAHRPSIVSHHEVYNVHARPMITKDDMETNGIEQVVLDADLASNQIDFSAPAPNGTIPAIEPNQPEPEPQPEPACIAPVIGAENGLGSQLEQPVTKPASQMAKVSDNIDVDDENGDESDNQVSSYLDLFVDKLNDT